MISSREEAEQWLREQCAEARERLTRLIGIHEATQSAGAFEVGEDDALRLLKAHVHLKAIVGWNIDHEYVLHLLAPDVRAATEQLEIIVANRAYGDDEGKRAAYRGLVAEQRRLLTNLSHPTGTMLNFAGHRGAWARRTRSRSSWNSSGSSASCRSTTPARCLRWERERLTRRSRPRFSR